MSDWELLRGMIVGGMLGGALCAGVALLNADDPRAILGWLLVGAVLGSLLAAFVAAQGGG